MIRCDEGGSETKPNKPKTIILPPRSPRAPRFLAVPAQLDTECISLAFSASPAVGRRKNAKQTQCFAE